tara:strand:+ start:606 stop:2561 length:1956 start_codon:yes stop_codon:yes gene_type:complete
LATEARELTARQRQQIVAQTRRTEQVIGRKFRNAMRKFFVGQAKRVTKGYMDAGGYLSAHADGEYKDPASQLLGVNEDQAIVAASRPYVLEMTVAAINAASDLVGAPRVAAAKALKEPDILGTDPTVLFLTDQSAQRVVQVNDATRRGVQRTIVKGAAAGYSDYEIAYGSTRTRKDGFRPLKGMVERLYHGRPECIARTELAYSNNGAALHRYSQWGQDMVEVSDGPGCALTHHVQGLRPGESSSDDINGQKIAVKEANNWQVAHPNCRRVFLPLRQVRKPTTPPMEAEAFITRPLTRRQRGQIAVDMARTRVRKPSKPPAPPQVIEQVVAPPPPPPIDTVTPRTTTFVEAKTLREAEEFAVNAGLALEADYTGFTVYGANQANRALFDVTRRYKTVPLEQLKVEKHLGRSAQSARADALWTHKGGIVRLSSSELEPKFSANALKRSRAGYTERRARALQRIEELEEQNRRRRGSRTPTAASIIKKNDVEIEILKERDGRLRQYIIGDAAGAPDGIYSSVVHEMGHIVHGRAVRLQKLTKPGLRGQEYYAPTLGGMRDKEIYRRLGGTSPNNATSVREGKIKKSAKQEAWRLSEYGGTDTKERFAEAFTAVFTDTDVEYLAPDIVDLVKELAKRASTWTPIRVDRATGEVI